MNNKNNIKSKKRNEIVEQKLRSILKLYFMLLFLKK